MLGLLLCVILAPAFTHAQAELVPDEVYIERARVTDVAQERTITIPGTDTPGYTQTLTAEILEGRDKGKTVTFENDYTQLTAGEEFYLRHQRDNIDNAEYWSVSDPYRLHILLYLTLAFLTLLFVFGGIQGIRGLVSLLGSLVLIMYALLPGILAGYSPVLISIGVSSLIIITGSYVTHGFTKTTTAAVLGMIATVILTGISAYAASYFGHFSGYSGEEQVYLHFNTRGDINMLGLLFGGIMIGLLGVLYDIAIGQAVAVEELFTAGTLARHEVYARGMRIGREHIGALVNTLAIAYVGAALPLLLLLVQSHSADTNVFAIINSELFATEIVRILIGSIGLVLAVPITTFIATSMLSGSTARSGGHSHAHM